MIVDAVTGKGNVRMDVVLYNTPFYLYLYTHKNTRDAILSQHTQHTRTDADAAPSFVIMRRESKY